MRIVSLVPSATEILFQLGAGDDVVGVTYACDYPAEAQTKQVVVLPTVKTKGLSSREIDKIISETYARGEPLYTIDTRLLSELRPDVIIAQGLCEVCAAAPGSVEEVVKTVNPAPKVLTLHPHSIKDVLNDVLRVGMVVGRVGEALELMERLQAEIRFVSERARGLPRKKTFFMEWVDPPYCSGHWVPEMIEVAGGSDFGVKGKPSRRVAPEEILRFEPEAIICGPCGYSLPESLQDAKILSDTAWVRETPAFSAGEVYAVDAKLYFSRHGPSMIKGILVAAEILHPRGFRGVAPPASYARVEGIG
ncbi:MAG: ABC transporter substrate-binding protein [Nitrososphaerota archaeon]|nr:ABC transporter substrate-binding protein [Candidatus Calditenuaceae archaeon]MDW8073281.1 ABC transporter substrate-binding protein [Nitrososphaerota archaeon]